MKITTVSDRQMRESLLANIINTVCAKHGCTAKIDFWAKTIDIDGPEEKREVIADELTRFFG